MVTPTNESMKLCVIPKPERMELTGGRFTLKATTSICIEKNASEVREIANYLAEHLRPATGLGLKVLESSEAEAWSDSIVLSRVKGRNELAEEGYELTVTPERVLVRAAKPAGLFFGAQSIRQLLPAEIENKEKVTDARWSIPCVRIEDGPRFGWRGSLLDCSREFMSKEFVKRYIELLAYHKMNRFHWHLTDDQGWRIEIKKYPRLTEVGAWRGEGGSRYGGFYTQQDILDIVEYARRRYVTVVPEVEMPGHCRAALAAYPELSCTGGPFEVPTEWGVKKDVYCAGEEKVFEFLENVLSEVVKLFDSPCIHIGGDECPKERWKECPKCRARTRSEGLKDEEELQGYFIKRIARFLLGKGRRIIGWDEILAGGLANGAIVQSWRGTEGALAAAATGHEVIMSPNSHCYFNFPSCREEKGPFPEWMKVIPIEKVYSFEPIPEGLEASQHKYILGGEGNMWTEFLPQKAVDSRAYPRLTALAEVLWSPKHLRDWEDFAERLKVHCRRLELLGVDYFWA